MNDDFDKLVENERAHLAAQMAKVAELEEMQRARALFQKHGFTLTKTDAEIATAAQIDGSFRSLIDRYRTDPLSPYQKLRHGTRVNYNAKIDRILERCGPEKIGDWDEHKIQALYENFCRGGDGRETIAFANDLINIFRVLIRFGAYALKDNGCTRLMVRLPKVNVKTAPRRKRRQLTDEQVRAIIKKAHEMGQHSIALAQAFQADFGLKQRDVVGEWVPFSSKEGLSNVIDGDEKWVRGLRWNEIDDDLIWRRASGDAIDLTRTKFVAEELRWLGNRRKKTGPMIESDYTGKPWRAVGYRSAWRRIAIEARVLAKDDEEHSETDRPADAEMRSAGR